MVVLLIKKFPASIISRNPTGFWVNGQVARLKFKLPVDSISLIRRLGGTKHTGGQRRVLLDGGYIRAYEYVSEHQGRSIIFKYPEDLVRISLKDSLGLYAGFSAIRSGLTCTLKQDCK